MVNSQLHQFISEVASNDKSALKDITCFAKNTYTSCWLFFHKHHDIPERSKASINYIPLETIRASTYFFYGTIGEQLNHIANNEKAALSTFSQYGHISWKDIASDRNTVFHLNTAPTANEALVAIEKKILSTSFRDKLSKFQEAEKNNPHQPIKDLCNAISHFLSSAEDMHDALTSEKRNRIQREFPQIYEHHSKVTTLCVTHTGDEKVLSNQMICAQLYNAMCINEISDRLSLLFQHTHIRSRASKFPDKEIIKDLRNSLAHNSALSWIHEHKADGSFSMLTESILLLANSIENNYLRSFDKSNKHTVSVDVNGYIHGLGLLANKELNTNRQEMLSESIKTLQEQKAPPNKINAFLVAACSKGIGNKNSDPKIIASAINLAANQIKNLQHDTAARLYLSEEKRANTPKEKAAIGITRDILVETAKLLGVTPTSHAQSKGRSGR